MPKMDLTQRTSQFLSQEYYLEIALAAFLRDRKAGNSSHRTIDFYREKLTRFLTYCTSQQITNVTHITPDTIRSYMLYMSEVRHNNKGNIHGFYRSIRAFLNWFEIEYEPDDWRNPIKKVKPPKQSNEIIDPVPLDNIQKLLNTCGLHTYTDIRDHAIILTLLDTGVRAAELLAMRIDNISPDGSILIPHGKGDKPREVYLGKDSRRALRKYLKLRQYPTADLWITTDDTPLTYDGLRAIIARRSKLAGITPPPIHSFRRAFALAMLRNGVDVFSLQKLLGHTSLAVVRKYLSQNADDTKLAHLKGSPVDNLKK